MATIKVMPIITDMRSEVKPPKIVWKKPTEGEVEPVEMAVITVEVPITGLEEQREAIKTLAMYAHQGYPVQVTITAEQSRFTP